MYSVLFLLLLLFCFIFILVLLLCCVSRSSLYCNIPSDLCTLCLFWYYFYIVFSLCLYCRYVVYIDHHFTVIFLQICVLSFSIQSCRSCYAAQHLYQRSFNKIFVKVRNSKINVPKIVLIIVNIYEDENKSLFSNQFSPKNDFHPLLGELFCGGKK